MPVKVTWSESVRMNIEGPLDFMRAFDEWRRKNDVYPLRDSGVSGPVLDKHLRATMRYRHVASWSYEDAEKLRAWLESQDAELA